MTEQKSRAITYCSFGHCNASFQSVWTNILSCVLIFLDQATLSSIPLLMLLCKVPRELDCSRVPFSFSCPQIFPWCFQSLFGPVLDLFGLLVLNVRAVVRIVYVSKRLRGLVLISRTYFAVRLLSIGIFGICTFLSEMFCSETTAIF